MYRIKFKTLLFPESNYVGMIGDVIDVDDKRWMGFDNITDLESELKSLQKFQEDNELIADNLSVERYSTKNSAWEPIPMDTRANG